MEETISIYVDTWSKEVLSIKDSRGEDRRGAISFETPPFCKSEQSIFVKLKVKEHDPVESYDITLTKGEALRLARNGRLVGHPTVTAPKFVIGAFGEGLVRGWLQSIGYEISDRPLIIRAEDFGLEVFPSMRRFRTVEIVTADETLAVEVKTYSSHYVQGTSGDTLEDQLKDAPRWRRRSAGRTLMLAIVNYYGRPGVSKADLSFIRRNHIPILRFIIHGMTS